MILTIWITISNMENIKLSEFGFLDPFQDCSILNCVNVFANTEIIHVCSPLIIKFYKFEHFPQHLWEHSLMHILFSSWQILLIGNAKIQESLLAIRKYQEGNYYFCLLIIKTIFQAEKVFAKVVMSYSIHQVPITSNHYLLRIYGFAMRYELNLDCDYNTYKRAIETI